MVPTRYCFLIYFSLSASGALASGDYEFCVDRASPSKREILHVRFLYGDIDPGKEAARVIISQRYRQADTTEVGVTDYSQVTCNGTEVEEVSVSATPEQLEHLMNAVGKGDIPGAVVVAVDIAAGATVTVVMSAGKAAGGIVEGAKRIICGLFRC